MLTECLPCEDSPQAESAEGSLSACGHKRHWLTSPSFPFRRNTSSDFDRSIHLSLPSHHTSLKALQDANEHFRRTSKGLIHLFPILLLLNSNWNYYFKMFCSLKPDRDKTWLSRAFKKIQHSFSFYSYKTAFLNRCVYIYIMHVDILWISFSKSYLSWY